MKKTLISALIATLPLAATVAMPAKAADELNVGPGVTYAGAPLALHGADPVALLDQEQTVTGSPQYFAAHEGAAFYFTSEANKAAFEANPERYAPQNGGFCTFGVSVGKKFDGNPQHFDVHDGKIFVFLNADTRDAYFKDVEGTIAKADAQWAEIEHVAAGDL